MLGYLPATTTTTTAIQALKLRVAQRCTAALQQSGRVQARCYGQVAAPPSAPPRAGAGATLSPSPAPASSYSTRPARPARYWPLSLSSNPGNRAGAGAAPRPTAASGLHSQPDPAPIPDFSFNRQFSSIITQQVNEFARLPQKGLTLQELLAVGPNPTKEALLQSAQFLHRELPIRLAKRVKELDSLPYGLSQMAPVQKVRNWYEESFREILSTPEPQTEAEELAFTELLDAVYQRHADVVPTLAQGVLLMKKELGSSGNDVLNQCPYLQDFLNRFHASRIGIRLLISQHLAIHHPVPGYIGTVATSISPLGVIRDAISDAARICDREYGWAPEVEIIGEDLIPRVNFVPTHLHHVCFELMKNSMRAVLEFHGVKNYDAPAIQVVISEDERELGIKISDQGGGIPRNDMPRIWSYLYTTTSTNTAQQLLDKIGGSTGSEGPDAAGGHPTNAVGPSAGEGAPMSGFGYGLPIRYLGGDLNVVSVEGYGTDAYVYLNKLGDYNLFLE